MSYPFSFPANTSPISPVRSREDLKSNYGSTRSQRGRNAIASAELAHHIQLGPLSRSLTDITAYHATSTQIWRGDGIITALVDSPASTPRLRSTQTGSDELDCIPQDVFTGLDDPKPLFPPDNTVPLPLNPNQYSLSTSIEEITFTHSQLDSSSIVQISGLSIQGTRLRPVRNLSGGVFLSSCKPKGRRSDLGADSLNSMNRPHMSGAWEPGAENKNNGGQGGQPLSDARREAFTEEKRNRSSSRTGKGRVEKKIEATLPKVEQLPNARSRKSSHILGLFKENTASQEIKKAQDKSRLEPNAASGIHSAVQEDDRSKVGSQEGLSLPILPNANDGRESKPIIKMLKIILTLIKKQVLRTALFSASVLKTH